MTKEKQFAPGVGAVRSKDSGQRLRQQAEKAVEEVIRLTNSRDRSTLLNSSEPALTLPAPMDNGVVILASPLFGPMKKTRCPNCGALMLIPPAAAAPAGGEHEHTDKRHKAALRRVFPVIFS